MSNENKHELNVPAFALAGGVIGLILGVFMMGSGMMCGGMIGCENGFGGIGMGIIAGIGSGAFALVYNWLCTRSN